MYILLDSQFREGLIIYRGQLNHVFQPIYYLNSWLLYGHEGFLRTELAQDIEGFFRHAMKSNRLYELDITSIHNVILTYFQSDYNNKLFINVFPSTITHQDFFPFIEKLMKELQFTSNKIIFEINEGEDIRDLKKLRIAVTRLRELGFTFAIDDFGKGSTTMQTIIELEPEFVKLDRMFATDLHLSEKKQEEIYSLINDCKDTSQIILEGIEKPVELAIAKSIGVPLGQGYLLGMPENLNNSNCEEFNFQKLKQ